MDSQSIFNLAAGTGLTVMGWLARELWTAVKELKNDLAKLREQLPVQYLAKTDFEKAFDKIDAKLDKIVDKLDTKADK